MGEIEVWPRFAGKWATSADALGQCPFDPGSLLILLLALLTSDPRPSRLRRLVLHLRWESHAPSLLLRPRADCPRGTPLAVFERKLNEDTPAAHLPAVFPPVGRPFALGAAHAPVRPIDLKVLDRIGPFEPGPATQGSAGSGRVR